MAHLSGPGSFFISIFLALPGEFDGIVGLGAGGGDERAGLGVQRQPEFDLDFVGRVGQAAQPGDDGPRRRFDLVQRRLERLAGSFHHLTGTRGLYHAALRCWFIHLHQDRAAVLQREFDQLLHLAIFLGFQKALLKGPFDLSADKEPSRFRRSGLEQR